MSKYSTVRHTFHVFAYKIQNYQTITAATINGLETFTNATLQQLDDGEIDRETFGFQIKVIFFPEGFINKQNLRI